MSEEIKDQSEEQVVDQLNETLEKSEECAEEQIETVEENTSEEITSEEAEQADEATEEIQEELEEPKSPEEVIADLELSLLRQRADFDNFRKRSVRDQEDARQRGKTSVLEDVLPVYDTFKMAMQATEMDNVNLDMIVQGMNMIQNMFIKAMDDMGVVEINAQGEMFDPNLHEATSESHSDEVEEGTVLSQTRCGYKLSEKLLRPAMVVVSKGPEAVVEEELIESEES
ncbi:nucleotide exchange factor GrpE [Lentisphaera marina]|uniref:nucleotide exchange factor GrpE n=1 Tax=Lentisphaera marina TaxID=1111041 RepID=UPI002366D193|nr:nucleotide exchange factor GrpE [Lentisphaera marina]MDD7984964.1 nucleotide exchange factor GrpE [Lentisphaera marina]